MSLSELVPGATRGRFGFQKAFDDGVGRAVSQTGYFCEAGRRARAQRIGANAYLRIHSAVGCGPAQKVVGRQLVLAIGPQTEASQLHRHLLVGELTDTTPLALFHAAGDGVAIANPAANVFDELQSGWQRRRAVNANRHAPGTSRPSVERVAAIQEKHSPTLLAMAGVVGTMVTVDDNPHIIVLTDRDVARGAIPETIEGVRAPVRNVGVIENAACPRSRPCSLLLHR